MTNLPPSSRDIECAVLGAVFLEPDSVIKQAITESGADLFYYPEHAIMFKAFDYLYEHGETVDTLSVTNYLAQNKQLHMVGGEASIYGLVKQNWSTANYANHIKQLKELSLLRKIITLTTSIKSECYASCADANLLYARLRSGLHDIKDFQTKKHLTLTEEIREWVVTTKGDFLTTDVYKNLNLTTRDDKKTCARILLRLVEEGLIERFRSRKGSYRVVEGDCEKIDLSKDGSNALDLAWPFGIEKYVEIMPGNVIVIAGEPNSGKTAFLLNFVKRNMKKFPIHYFTSEMGGSEFQKRLKKFSDLALKDWKFTPWERSANFEDVIKPDAVNVIDYLEIHDEFWRLGGQIKEIFDRLDKGIALIAIQKNRNTDIGRGGIATLEKPRLYLSIAPGECTIVKGKNWAMSTVNPNGMKFNFKLVQGAEFKVE